jgi:hypothetical protein
MTGNVQRLVDLSVHIWNLASDKNESEQTVLYEALTDFVVDLKFPVSLKSQIMLMYCNFLVFFPVQPFFFF